MSIKVVIADDQALFRKVLIAILQNSPGIEVQAEAADANQIIEIFRQSRPDILLLDLNIPGMNGYDVLHWVKAKHPRVKVIVISMYDEEKYVIAAIESGACGFISKNAHINEVYDAVMTAFTSGFYFNNLTTNALLNSDPEKTWKDISFKPPLASFSEIEISIITLIAQKTTHKQISELLSESVESIESHLAKIMEKTRANDIESVIQYATSHNII